MRYFQKGSAVGLRVTVASRTIRLGIFAILAVSAPIGDARAAPGDLQAAVGTVRLLVLEQATRQAVPCRVHLKDAQSQPKLFDHLPSFRDHFCFDGDEVLVLAPGAYTYVIERGPEYGRCRGSFQVEQGDRLDVTGMLTRLADLAAEGWWSGDLHVHRAVKDIELLMKAEDLHVAPLITWWNASSVWQGAPLPSERVRCFDGTYFCDLLAGEDERAGGAFMYFNMTAPIDITRAQPEYPSPLHYIEQARRQTQAWIDIEKPFWWDVPVALAHGYGDSIGLANNHCWRSEMLDNEAWGKPRDRREYPGPHGNGLWSQEIYYAILNAGIRIPPSAGSASGVLSNPVGYNRVYVYTGDRGLRYEDWWASLRQGRCFVSNGPLVVSDVSGRRPGHVFQAAAGQSVDLEVKLKLHSVDPIDRIEIVKNGTVERSLSFAEFEKAGGLGTLRFNESGWFLIRAIADVDHTFRFGSTGPYYVEIGASKHRVSEKAVRFFLDWVQERMSRIRLADPEEHGRVMEYHQEARRFWDERLEVANAD